MFTTAFIKHYPLPWRTQGVEVVDRYGDHVIAFQADTPEDREFWENVVVAVNAVTALHDVAVPDADDDDLIRVGTQVVEMAEQVRRADQTDLGARGTWHLEIDEERYRVVMTVAGTGGVAP